MQVQIDVWSDYVCPFCYLVEPALRGLKNELGDAVEVRWRAYELRPEPVPTLEPDSHYLRDIWTHKVAPMAAERGMPLQIPPVQPRSRLAHEAAYFAGAQGMFEPMNLAIFHAFFIEGWNIGQREVLIEIGCSVGLDGPELRSALETRSHRNLVLADEEKAAELGLTGVPAMIVHRKSDPPEMALRILGLQSELHIRRVIESVLNP